MTIEQSTSAHPAPVSAGYINAADLDSPLRVTPVTGRIGAEVHGVTLSDTISEAALSAIKAALVRHKVLFFRGQHQLDDAAQEAFGERWGPLVAHPTVPVRDGTRHILEIDSIDGHAANSWHTDVTFVSAYPQASILRGVVIPEAGGDTLWANAAAAYATLPDELRALADTLWAVHSNDYDYAEQTGGTRDPKILEQRALFTKTVYETEHPLVRVHPESGERSLVLGHFFKHFVGLRPSDSRRLFDVFQDQITRPENVVRWRWQAGDVAIWDNRATQHRAIADFDRQRRTVRRVTIEGDAPVGIDGRRSRPIKPAPGLAELSAAA
ncbi:TauD/TfdA dioxygenase family protein [Rhizorhabdus argentea]|uniref:TauD/TfdA dioxygenase family protein n=1 Tax=Rhizorhabdus argentea TaxID=1387174 RepID=UPI0030EE4DAB